MQRFAFLFLLLAIGFGTFGFYQHGEAGRLRARVVALETSLAEKQAAAAQLEERTAKLTEQATTHKAVIEQLESRNKELAAAPVATRPEASNGRSGGGGEGDFMKGLAKMFNDPKTRESMRAQQAAQVSVMFSSLGQELGLAPDVARQVLAILGDRQMDLASKGMAALSASSDPAAAQAMAKETDALKKTYDDQIKALLGEAGYRQFTQYEESIGDRMALEQIQRQLAATGTNLEPAQQKSLLEIMVAERKQTQAPSATTLDPKEGMRVMQDETAAKNWLASQEAMNQRVVDRARAVLSADQLAAFSAAQKQFLELQKMGVQMSRQLFQKK